MQPLLPWSPLCLGKGGGKIRVWGGCVCAVEGRALLLFRECSEVRPEQFFFHQLKKQALGLPWWCSG